MTLAFMVIPCRQPRFSWFVFFFFNDTATTEIYTLSLHDALPIFAEIEHARHIGRVRAAIGETIPAAGLKRAETRSEEHTSELQSRLHLVCRLLLEKKKQPKQVLRAHA